MGRAGRALAVLFVVAAVALIPLRARAQSPTPMQPPPPPTSSDFNITYSEFKLGLWAHDIGFLGGKEDGVDINPELLLASPIPDAWVNQVTPWLRWMLQPRPTLGASISTAGETDQFWVGPSWAWMLTRNIFNPGDGFYVNYFFGPGFNDGNIGESNPHRKALGAHILFREAIDFGYQINPTWSVSLYMDHISNGGFAKYNQGLNDIGVRLGFRF
jgi:lipid A 3-O-deacylase